MLGIFAPGAVSQVRQRRLLPWSMSRCLGVFASAIAYAAWTKAFAKAQKTSWVSNYMFITPFLAGILGYFLAGERLDKATVVGEASFLSGFFSLFSARIFLPVLKGRKPGLPSGFSPANSRGKPV